LPLFVLAVVCSCCHPERVFRARRTPTNLSQPQPSALSSSKPRSAWVSHPKCYSGCATRHLVQRSHTKMWATRQTDWSAPDESTTSSPNRCTDLPSAFAMQGQEMLTLRTGASRKCKANANLAFVTEYVRELYAVENIRDSVNGANQGCDSDEMSNAIYFGTRMQIELRAEVKTLQEMRLAPPFDNSFKASLDSTNTRLDCFRD